MTADPLVDLRRRFTVEEYERMGEVGIFDPADRVELLDGEIVYRSPIGARHAGVVNRVNRLFNARLGDRALVDRAEPTAAAASIGAAAGRHGGPLPTRLLRQRTPYG